MRDQLRRKPHTDLQLGLPIAGVWEEVLNTDASIYTGSGVGNLGSVTAHTTPSPSFHGFPASATITAPPLGAVWFRLGSTP